MYQKEVFLKYNFIRHSLSCVWVFLVCLFTACHTGSEKKQADAPETNRATGLKYAQRFSIVKKEQYTLLYLFGNRYTNDTTAAYCVYSDTSVSMHPEPGAILIKAPCTKIAALSSIYATLFCELGDLDKLAAIDNIDYVNNQAIINKHHAGKLKELMKSPHINLEQTIILQPDIIFTFGMGEGEKDKDKKLEQTGIPVAISIDHLEESPLARAEWIKFYAVFVNKQQRADSIFDTVEKNYLALKALAEKTSERPTVFSEIKYSDFWYMPGGKSYIAQLLNDAASTYLWKGDGKSGSLPLSFEQVFAKAKDADFWINLSTLKNKKELLGFESRYAEFKAYKTGNLYNNTLHTNTKGYSVYWETGMIYPDRILSDLIQIFHSDLRAEIQNEFYYYEQLGN